MSRKRPASALEIRRPGRGHSQHGGHHLTWPAGNGACRHRRKTWHLGARRVPVRRAFRFATYTTNNNKHPHLFFAPRPKQNRDSSRALRWRVDIARLVAQIEVRGFAGPGCLVEHAAGHAANARAAAQLLRNGSLSIQPSLDSSLISNPVRLDVVYAVPHAVLVTTLGITPV